MVVNSFSDLTFSVSQHLVQANILLPDASHVISVKSLILIQSQCSGWSFCNDQMALVLLSDTPFSFCPYHQHVLYFSWVILGSAATTYIDWATAPFKHHHAPSLALIQPIDTSPTKGHLNSLCALKRIAMETNINKSLAAGIIHPCIDYRGFNNIQ